MHAKLSPMAKEDDDDEHLDAPVRRTRSPTETTTVKYDISMATSPSEKKIIKQRYKEQLKLMEKERKDSLATDKSSDKEILIGAFIEYKKRKDKATTKEKRVRIIVPVTYKEVMRSL